MNKNNLNSKPHCPCCKEPKNKDISIRDRQLKQLEDENLVWYTDNFSNGGITTLVKDNHFTWACDTCIKDQKAIVARIEYQTYCDHPPYLAYYDQSKSCARCEQEFVFEKEEQQHWYEELKFWVQSIPENCASCRKELRNENVLSNRLSDLLENLDKEDAQALIEISQLYFELKKMGKGKLYASLAKKAIKTSKEST